MTEPIGRAFGTQPAPRVLYVFDQNEVERTAVEHIASDLSEVVPTWLVCDHDEVTRVRQASFGLVIAFGYPGPINQGLPVIQFGGVSTSVVVSRVANVRGVTVPHSWTLSRVGRSFATVWHVPAQLDEAYQRLAIRDLVPLVPRGQYRPDGHTGETPTLSLSGYRSWLTGDYMQPLLVDPDGNVFALRILGNKPWQWILPEGADAQAWVRLALRDLNAADPASFPIRSSWSDDARYRTAAEAASATELADTRQLELKSSEN